MLSSTVLSIVFVQLILGSSIWVLVDASILGIKAAHPKAGKRGFLDYGPVGCFIGCLLLWIVAFPAYLVKRRRYLAKASPRATPGAERYEDCPHCGTRLLLSPGLFGRAVTCPACQREFNAPGVSPPSWYRGPGPTILGWAVYGVLLLFNIVVLTQVRFDDLLRGHVTAKTAAIEAKVRKAIQERLANNSATKTEIKELSLARQSDGVYRGTLLTQTGERTEENEVVVDYDGGLMRWQVLPKQAAGARTSEWNWNRQEPDALKNGNIAVALQTILRSPDCRTDAEAPAPAVIVMNLSDYYGKPLKLSGKVYLINPLSAESGFGKALGGKPGSEILFVCSDKTVVDMLCTAPNQKVKTGDSATVYGFAIGTTQVPNPAGGVVTRLVLVGSECDVAVPR